MTPQKVNQPDSRLVTRNFTLKLPGSENQPQESVQEKQYQPHVGQEEALTNVAPQHPEFHPNELTSDQTPEKLPFLATGLNHLQTLARLELRQQPSYSSLP